MFLWMAFRKRPVQQKRSGLRMRLLLGAVTPLVIGAIAQAGYAVVAQRKAMMSGLEEKVSAVAGLLVNVVGPHVALNDDDAVKDGLTSLADGGEFVFALVTAADGRTIAYRGHKSERTQHEQAVARHLGIVDQGPLVMDVRPIEMDGKPLGRVAVGLSTVTVTERVLSIVLRAALISAGGGACAIIVVLLLAQEVVRRNRDMRLLLASVDQGFVTVFRDGRLAPERSRIVDRWLGRWQPELTFWQLLDSIDADTASWFEVAWSGLIEGVVPLEMAIDQLPKRLRRGTRTLQIDYKPLMKAHVFEKMLVVMSDITPQLQRERAEMDQRELLAVFEKISCDRRGFLEFVAEAEKQTIRLRAGGPAEEMKRLVHTLKGNASLFGLTSVATVCHDVETRMAEHRTCDDSELARCAQAWRDAKSRFEFLLGARQDTALEVSEEDYLGLVEAATLQLPHAEIERRLRSLRLEPLRPRLVRFGEQARAIALDLGRGDVVVHVEDHGVRLERERWAPFWSAFVHAIRNAVDHGLEAPEARAAAGKSPTCQLWLRAREDAAGLAIEIADDGDGIDWQRLADFARARGIPADTREQLVEALFAEGVSTRDNVTDLSGRGVGMSALRAACRELGGQLTVESVPRRGTTLTFSWPRSPLTSQAIALLACDNATVAGATSTMAIAT